MAGDELPLQQEYAFAWPICYIDINTTSFDPFIRYHTFADSAIDFTVILRGKAYTDQYLVTHEFITRRHRRFRDEKITIPFPQRTIHVASAEPMR